MGSDTITFTAAPLPTGGLTLSGNTITGAPLSSGTFVVHLTATNSAGSDALDVVIVVAPQQDLSVEHAQIKLNFAAQKSDSLSATFNLTLPDGTVLGNSSVTVLFGGATFSNMPTAARGRSLPRLAASQPTVTLKSVIRGSSSYMAVLNVKQTSLQALLAGNGLVNDDVTQPVTVPVTR